MPPFGAPEEDAVALERNARALAQCVGGHDRQLCAGRRTTGPAERRSQGFSEWQGSGRLKTPNASRPLDGVRRLHLPRSHTTAGRRQVRGGRMARGCGAGQLRPVHRPRWKRRAPLEKTTQRRYLPTQPRTASPRGRSLHNNKSTRTTWSLLTTPRTASPGGRSLHNNKSPRTTWSLPTEPRTAGFGVHPEPQTLNPEP